MYNKKIAFDSRDCVRLAEIMKKRESRIDPQVGDMVMAGMALKRIAHIHEDGDVQLCGGGSFYLDSDGGASMSGALDCSEYNLSDFENSGHRYPVKFWFFHHGESGADRGVEFTIGVPLWWAKGRKV